MSTAWIIQTSDSTPKSSMQPELFWHQRKRFNICFTYHTQKVHRFLSNIRFEWKETAKTNGRKICLSVDSRRHRYSVTVNGWESGADWKSQLNSSLFTKIPGAEYIQVGRSRGCQDPQVLSHSYSKHSSTRSFHTRSLCWGEIFTQPRQTTHAQGSKTQG